jgi:hypothetical protein
VDPLFDRQNFDRFMKAGITIVLLVGFFGCLVYMLWKGTDAPTLSLMIGALIAALGTSINFQFGSTASDVRKTELLAQAAPVNTPPTTPEVK